MNSLLTRIDKLIEEYKTQHNGEPPLYIILSSDANKEVMNAIREADNIDEEHLVTEYKGIKLAQHPNLTDDKIYVSNELPETGS